MAHGFTITRPPEAGPTPRSSYLRQPWNDALAAYRVASKCCDLAQSEVDIDDCANEVHRTLQVLARTRVPDLDALREKIRIIRAELGETTYEPFHNLLADIDGLN